MMFTYADWNFSVDAEKTKNFYERLQLRFPSINIPNQDMQDLIKNLSIDIKKPTEISEDFYEACYIVYGKAISINKFEIDFCNGKHNNTILILPQNTAGTEESCQPSFVVAIENFSSLLD